jgi:hypothetical protein
MSFVERCHSKGKSNQIKSGLIKSNFPKKKEVFAINLIIISILPAGLSVTLSTIRRSLALGHNTL